MLSRPDALIQPASISGEKLERKARRSPMSLSLASAGFASGHGCNSKWACNRRWRFSGVKSSFSAFAAKTRDASVTTAKSAYRPDKVRSQAYSNWRVRQRLINSPPRPGNSVSQSVATGRGSKIGKASKATALYLAAAGAGVRLDSVTRLTPAANRLRRSKIIANPVRTKSALAGYRESSHSRYAECRLRRL